MLKDKKKKIEDFNDPNATPGVICKTATVAPLKISDEDLEKINKYTLTPVSVDEVFIFKATIADNEQDDRNYMPFDLEALQDMKSLYIGKPMIKDHDRVADNQIGRVFDTELVSDENKTTELGEVHTELVAKVYMIKTDSNKDLIAEINGGIKKEVSTNTVPKRMICNICGRDNMKDYCNHFPGREYTAKDSDGKAINKPCKMILSGVKDTWELSLVAVPAQPRAGAHKSIGFTKPIEPTEEPIGLDKEVLQADERLLSQRVKSMESFFNAEKAGGEK